MQSSVVLQCPQPSVAFSSGPMHLLSIWRLRLYVFIKPVFINYKGQTFPAAEIWTLGVSYFLAGGEGSRFSHGVKSWHWSPTACEGMLSSECWFYLSFGHQFICSTIFSLN